MAKPSQTQNRQIQRKKLVPVSKPVSQLQKPTTVVRPAQVAQPVQPNPTTPSQKLTNHDSLIPYYMNMGAILEDIQQIKVGPEPVVNHPPADQNPASDSNTSTLSGYVLEKQVARPVSVQINPPGPPPKRHRKRRSGRLSAFHREKPSLTASWVDKITIAESIQLCGLITDMIRTQVPEKDAILALADPPLKQTEQPFPAALIETLRRAGYAVADPDITLPQAHPVRYRIAGLSKDTLYVRLKVDNTELLKVYQRTKSGNLLDVSPETTLAKSSMPRREATP